MALIAQSRPVLQVLARDKRIRDVSALSLFHPDLHKRNIFVDPSDPTTITALINWQSASVNPAFFSARDMPDLCAYLETFEDILDDFDVQKSEGELANAQIEKEVSVHPVARVLFLADWAPRLHKARAIDSLGIWLEFGDEDMGEEKARQFGCSISSLEMNSPGMNGPG